MSNDKLIPVEPVPTVELLTRAADAAGKHAGELLPSLWANMPMPFAASGPDHWRAVEALFRAALARTEQVAATVGCTIEQAAATSVILPFLRPLAEQVLQHLGDTA